MIKDLWGLANVNAGFSVDVRKVKLTKPNHSKMKSELRLRLCASCSLLALLLLALTGCQTPDLKPFAESTAAMHTAIKEGQKVFVRELEAIRTADKEATYIDDALSTFTNHWSLRVAFMDTMVDYSEQLAAVADAPRQRGENTKAVAEAVEKVAGTFGPYGAAVGGGLEIVRKVDNLVAQVRAARTLQQAVERANPVVTNVVPLLIKDLKKLQNTLPTMRLGLRSSIQEQHGDALEARKNLLARLPPLYRRLADEIADPDANWATAAADFNTDVAEVAKTLMEMDRWYLPLAARIKEDNQRIDAGIALLSEAQAGLQRWMEIHRKLGSDLAERRQPNWRLLLETAREIQNDIERIKKHETN